MTWTPLSIYGWLAREPFTCENKDLVFIARRPVTNMARGRDGALCRSGHRAVRYAVLGTAFELVAGLPVVSEVGANR